MHIILAVLLSLTLDKILTKGAAMIRYTMFTCERHEEGLCCLHVTLKNVGYSNTITRIMHVRKN